MRRLAAAGITSALLLSVAANAQPTPAVDLQIAEGRLTFRADSLSVEQALTRIAQALNAKL